MLPAGRLAYETGRSVRSRRTDCRDGPAAQPWPALATVSLVKELSPAAMALLLSGSTLTLYGAYHRDLHLFRELPS